MAQWGATPSIKDLPHRWLGRPILHKRVDLVPSKIKAPRRTRGFNGGLGARGGRAGPPSRHQLTCSNLVPTGHCVPLGASGCGYMFRPVTIRLRVVSTVWWQVPPRRPWRGGAPFQLASSDGAFDGDGIDARHGRSSAPPLSTALDRRRNRPVFHRQRCQGATAGLL
jgi:hypothetical protein